MSRFARSCVWPLALLISGLIHVSGFAWLANRQDTASLPGDPAAAVTQGVEVGLGALQVEPPARPLAPSKPEPEPEPQPEPVRKASRNIVRIPPPPDPLLAPPPQDKTPDAIEVARVPAATEALPPPPVEMESDENAESEVDPEHPNLPATAVQASPSVEEVFASRSSPANPPADIASPGTRTSPSSTLRRGESNRYLLRIKKQLMQHKVYPPELKRKKQQGVVRLRFTIAADGSVAAQRVEEGSGISRLDAAALAVLADAAPFPPIPESLGRHSLTLVLPINYSLITNR